MFFFAFFHHSVTFANVCYVQRDVLSYLYEHCAVHIATLDVAINPTFIEDWYYLIYLVITYDT